MNRKLTMLIAALMGGTLIAAEQALCTVGVTAISSTLTNTIVAVSYDDLGGETGMNVSNLVKTTNLSLGDKVAVLNNSKTYDTWVLDEGAGGAKFWAKQEKTYTVDANGQLVVGTGESAASTFLSVGTGLWICRQKPTDGGAAIPFYLYGKPASSKSVTVASDTWTLVGNPTQDEVTIGPTWVTATKNDQIVAFGADGKLWYYTYKDATKGWRTTDADGNWIYVSPKIGAGIGFWIRLANGGIINW